MSSKRSRWRTLVLRVTEQAYALGFRCAGRFDRMPWRPWTPLGGGRVLVIAPHPDDECTGCGGTIALHCGAGDHVAVWQITDGGASRAGQTDPASMAQVRAEEARQALGRLGVGCFEQFGLREKAWDEDALRERLRVRLAHHAPDLVYAPSCIDFHPEHLRVARVLAQALNEAPRALVRIYAITVPLTTALVNRVVDTSSVSDQHDAALAAYRSQGGALQPVRRMRRYWACYFGMTHSAEVFWELSVLSYQKLMRDGDWLQQANWAPWLTPYRSLRLRPFTDPLAFWRGRQSRRNLKWQVEEQR